MKLTWRGLDNATLGYGGGSATGLVGTTSLTLPVDAKASAVGSYYAYIVLTGTNPSVTTTYLYDPTFSTTNYTAERATPAGKYYRAPTPYPLLMVDVTN